MRGSGRSEIYTAFAGYPFCIARRLVEVLPAIVATQRAEQDEYLARIRHQE